MAFKVPVRPIGLKGESRKPRKESRGYLAFIRRLPCLKCHTIHRIHAAHVRYHSFVHGKPITGIGRKPHDYWTVPLCEAHHVMGADAQHNRGEREWWSEQGIDPLIIAPLLFLHFSLDDEDAATQVAISAREISRGIGNV